MVNKETSTINGNVDNQLHSQIADLQKQVAVLNERQAQLDKGEK